MNKELKERIQSQLANLIADLNTLRVQVDRNEETDEVWQRFDGIESQFSILTESIDEMEE